MAKNLPSREFFDTLKPVIESHPVLSPEEEQALIKEHADNPEYVREKLILHNIRLAVDFGMSRYDRVAACDDLCQRALVALVKAARDFDLNCGTRFNTYAMWVIKSAFNDLSGDRGKGLVHRATVSCLDRNVDGKDGESDTTVANFVHQDGELVDPAYVLPDPSSDDKRRIEEDDYKALAAYVAKSITSLGGAKSDAAIRSEYKSLIDYISSNKGGWLDGGVGDADFEIIVKRIMGEDQHVSQDSRILILRLQGNTRTDIATELGIQRDFIGKRLELIAQSLKNRIELGGDDPDLGQLIDIMVHHDRDMNEQRRKILTLRLRGNTLDKIGEKFGLSRERIRQILDKIENGIREKIREREADPELEFLVRKMSHYQDESPKVTNDEISEFIRENKIRITSRVGRAIRDDHLRKVFEDALAYYCSKAGTRTDDPVYGMMRKVYAQNVICRKSINKTAEILGIPLAYAKFHRKRAFQIMKDHRISQKPSERAKSLHDNGIQVHLKPWYGGFYSEWSRYHRFEHEIEMTQRELAINIKLGNVYKQGGHFRVASGRRTNTESYDGLECQVQKNEAEAAEKNEEHCVQEPQVNDAADVDSVSQDGATET